VSRVIAEILLGISTVALVLSVYYNYKFARIILRVEDAIEESLDDLDARYQTMSEIVKRPVFFDSVEVRQVISELGLSRDVILKIANRLTSVGKVNE
jgi:hypothetical protein